MNLLNRYLLTLFVKYFFTVNAGFVAIYLLVDFFEKIDDFNNAGKPFSLALQYFLFTIPFIVDQLGPVFILLAGVISLGILNHSNELTALKAGGIPLRLITRPFLAAALAFTLLFIAAAELLLPYSVGKTNNIWFEQLKGKVPLGIMRNNRYYYRGGDGFYSFSWPDPKEHRFQNFSYSRWDDNYNIHSLVIAEFAGWNEAEENWWLTNGQIQERRDEEYQISNFSERTMYLPERPEDFLIPANREAELSLSELFQEYEKSEVEHERRTMLTTFLGRISYAFLGLPLLLLGMPILLYSYRKWGRDLSVAIPASCGLAFLAWGLWGALQSLAIAGYIHPLSAALSIHLLFAATGFLLLRSSDR